MLRELGKWEQWAIARACGSKGEKLKEKRIEISDGTGQLASSTNPSTWRSYSEAIEWAKKKGPGWFPVFVLTQEDPYVIVDLDHCVSNGDQIAEWAQDISDRLDSYTEYSPSRTGLHVWLRGKLPPRGRKKGHIEAYEDARFMTVTGARVRSSPDEIRENPEQLQALHAEIFGKSSRGTSSAAQYAHTFDGSLPASVQGLMEQDADLSNLIKKSFADLPPKFDHLPSDSEVDMAVASKLRLEGLSASDADATLRWRREKIEGKRKADDYFHRTVAKVYDRPLISLSQGLEHVAMQACEAVRSANEPPSLFLRGGMPTVVRWRDAQPVLTVVRDSTVMNRIVDAADFSRGRNRRSGAHPPARLAGLVIDRLEQDAASLPRVLGISRTPILRPNGSLFGGEGYDAETRMYYAPTPGFKLGKIPSEPGKQAVKRALSQIEGVVKDFPFVGKADRATAIGVLVTLVAGPMIDGPRPLHLFDSPTQGTGKTLLVDALTRIATGHPTAAMVAPVGRYGEDEWRKVITATLMEGPEAILIDNLEESLGSSSLAAAITSPSWSGRLLGSSRNVHVANRALWMATGNNIRLRGDLPRRSVWCRLDAKEARPWRREQFDHPDLIAWVMKNRGALLAAVMTLVRAWTIQGRPKPASDVPALGSFEPWRHVVGGVLEVAGVQGFLGNLDKLHEETDDDTAAWAEFLSEWVSRIGTRRAFSASDVLDSLQEFLPPEVSYDGGRHSRAKSLGWALKRKTDTRFRGHLEGQRCVMWVVRAGGGSKSTRWRVEVEEA